MHEHLDRFLATMSTRCKAELREDALQVFQQWSLVVRQVQDSEVQLQHLVQVDRDQRIHHQLRMYLGLYQGA